MRVTCGSCGASDKSGVAFFRCDACGSWICSRCGYRGGRCPCGRGALR